MKSSKMWKVWVSISPLILDVTFNSVQLLSKHPTGFKVQHALLSSTKQSHITLIIQKIHVNSQQNRQVIKTLPVVDDFHIAVLFNPQFTDNYIMYTAKRVRPCVCLFMPVRIHTHIVSRPLLSNPRTLCSQIKPGYHWLILGKSHSYNQ